MIRLASCDSEIFHVQPGASGFHCAKPDSSIRNTSIEPWKKSNSTSSARLMRVQKAGEPWAWQYDAAIEGPEIWGVVSSIGTVIRTWEAETKADPERDSFNPIETTIETGASIIPVGGAALKIIHPDDTALATIEALVEAAALPAWVSDTRYVGVEGSEVLLYLLAGQFQAQRGLTIYPTLDDFLQKRMDAQRMLLYIHLWLRAASMILYDHRGETCIPLVKNRFTVDLTTGAVTV